MNADRRVDVINLAQRSIELFDQYIELKQANSYTRAEEAHEIAEVRDRLRQIEWACVQITHMEDQYFKIPWLQISLDADKTRFNLALQDLSHIRFMVEAVYMAAWQIREICQRVRELKFEAPGLRFARNQLIVHPNKPGGVVSWSHFIAPGGFGLSLANARSDDDIDKPLDRGFWWNITEFLTQFSNRITT